jgi:hypothetical protein
MHTSELVARAHALRANVARLEADLAEVEALLIAEGPGRYVTADGSQCVTVVAQSVGSVSYKLADADLEKAKEIAGDAFSTVFDRKVSFVPCKAFAEVVIKVVAKPVAKKLLALCEKAGATKRAHCRYA